MNSKKQSTRYAIRQDEKVIRKLEVEKKNYIMNGKKGTHPERLCQQWNYRDSHAFL